VGIGRCNAPGSSRWSDWLASAFWGGAS